MPSSQDHIIIHPRVLAAIAALTTLSVPGVAHLRPRRRAALARWFGGHHSPGVQVHIEGDVVSVDLHLVTNAGFGLLDVSRRVQATVARAISEMTDMQVGEVNVHIAGVRAATYS